MCICTILCICTNVAYEPENSVLYFSLFIFHSSFFYLSHNTHNSILFLFSTHHSLCPYLYPSSLSTSFSTSFSHFSFLSLLYLHTLLTSYLFLPHPYLIFYIFLYLILYLFRSFPDMRQSLMSAVIELNEEIDNVHAPICEQAQARTLYFPYLHDHLFDTY